MPYATPPSYLARFGLEEAAQLLADEERLLTSALLKQAIVVADGGSWPAGPTPEEQAAAEAALARLQRQLDVSSNFMDGYLRSAVTLPLAAGDANTGALEDCCLALARCAIADDADNATERMDMACKQWMRWLDDIARHRVQLIGSEGNTPPARGSVRSGQADSAIPWGLYGGVR